MKVTATATAKVDKKRNTTPQFKVQTPALISCLRVGVEGVS